MDKLYSEEQIKEWASKRADDAGRLSRQLLDTMRENERLWSVIKKAVDNRGDQGAVLEPLMNLLKEIQHKESVRDQTEDEERTEIAQR